MKTLRNHIMEAQRKKAAIAHFNVSDSTQFNAILEVAEALHQPVIIGVSESEEVFIGLSNIVAMVMRAREEGKQVYVNADHHRTYESAVRAIDAGVDAVIIDGAKLPIEENIALTQRVVAHARAVTAHRGRDILVEAELGYIGESSQLLKEVPIGVQKTDPDTAAYFVRHTEVDMLAPAVGNVHGIIESGEPNLDPALVAAIAQAARVPLVLHGASGNTDDDVRATIAAGIAVVHINTEIRVAYRAGIERALKEDEHAVSPYTYLAGGKEEMKKVVEQKMHLFAGV